MPVVRTPVKNRPFHDASLARIREYIWSWVILMAVGFGPTLAKRRAPVVRILPGQFPAKGYRYFMSDPGTITFALPYRHASVVDASSDGMYVAGAFNGWHAAVGDEAWRLKQGILDGERVHLWTGPAEKVIGGGDLRFKFVTGENQWLHPNDDAPNCVRDEFGNVNRVIDLERTGGHLWR